MTHRRMVFQEVLLKHIQPPALAQKKPQLEGRMMTIAERLREEGMKEGLKEGREIARKEHNEQLARLMISKKYDLASIMELTGMTESELKKLQC
ncbi:Rpn family recombination-promoting nuclease/putative transposase [Pantoea cypripedii]|nr:Rpn family recombination-promoting nuclease/putative transposase [Pantoea cypripedii]